MESAAVVSLASHQTVMYCSSWETAAPEPSSEPRAPSDVAHIKGPHQQVQVSDVGGLEQLGPVQHGDGDAQGGPDVGRHLLVAAALTPPLLVQSCQEVTDCLPAGPEPEPGQTKYCTVCEISPENTSCVSLVLNLFEWFTSHSWIQFCSIFGFVDAAFSQTLFRFYFLSLKLLGIKNQNQNHASLILFLAEQMPHTWTTFTLFSPCTFSSWCQFTCELRGWCSWFPGCIWTGWTRAAAPELWCTPPPPPHSGFHLPASPPDGSTAGSPEGGAGSKGWVHCLDTEVTCLWAV